MQYEQLSFLDMIKTNQNENKYNIYDATICYKCLCDKCKYNAESNCFSERENKAAWREYDLCFNCDECFFYGMDDDKLSKKIFRFTCSRFEILDYYADAEAKKRRNKFKII